MIGENTDTHYLQEEKGKRFGLNGLIDLKKQLRFGYEIASFLQSISWFSVSRLSSLHSRWVLLFTKCNTSLVKRHMETAFLSQKCDLIIQIFPFTGYVKLLNIISPF